MKKINSDCIVIGSGFGGSVTALRLVEKNYKVILIEKGKRFNNSDFPKTNWHIWKYLWFPKLFMYGIQCVTLFKNIFVLHGTGVGGGSLVYANTHIIPSEEAFLDPKWTHKNWYKKLLPFYKLAKKMLGTTKVPKLSLSDQLLYDTASKMKKEDTFEKVDVGIFFGKKNTTIPDPYFNGKGPERSGCNFCGGCMVGCRYNAKNTLDKNYLYLAEKSGLKIMAEKEVIAIKKISNAYQVDIINSTGFFKKNKLFIQKKFS